MKIATGISKEIKVELHENAGNIIPSQHKFTINIDDKSYDAIMYCYVIYNEKVTRDNMTGELQYLKENKKTTNKIEVYKFNDIEKIEQLQIERIFKVDDEDYYIGDVKKNSFKKDIQVSFIAINTNKF